jgi:hypothetical protein
MTGSPAWMGSVDEYEIETTVIQSGKMSRMTVTRKGQVRARLTLGLIAGAMLAVLLAAVVAQQTPYAAACALRSVSERTEEPCAGFPPGLIIRLGGEVIPRKLPRHEMAPVTVGLWGSVATSDATHPSALREATINFDRNIALDTRGLPVCHPPESDIRIASLRQICRDSIIGGGSADFEVVFPKEQPIRDHSRLTIYNRGVRNGVTTLISAAFIDVTVPAMIVTTIEISRSHRRSGGLQAVARVPVVAGGNGSLLDFKLRIGRLFAYRGSRRSVMAARCPRGELGVDVDSLLFKNEANSPGAPPTTLMQGALAIPCRSSPPLGF